ncbi:MAG: MipA/OmpV family protein, partial [Pseudomonadota bacterium]
GWRSSHPWGYGFALGLDGLTVDVYSTDRFGLSLGAGYDFGRDADDDKRFKGLGDIDGAVTGEIGITYAPFEFLELGLGATRYFGGSDGTLVTLGAGTGLPLGERAFVGLGVGATWADDAYMDAYYSVTPTQLSNALAKGNTTKGLKVFDAGAGIQSLDASLEVGYQISERWSIGAEVGVTQFVGDAADSPLVEEELQPNAGLMLVWQF